VPRWRVEEKERERDKERPVVLHTKGGGERAIQRQNEEHNNDNDNKIAASVRPPISSKRTHRHTHTHTHTHLPPLPCIPAVLRFHRFLERVHIDLIDMQDYPDSKLFRWVCVCTYVRMYTSLC